MSVSSISGSVASQAIQLQQYQPGTQARVGKNSDGDEATESAAAKAAESLSPNSSIPTSPGNASTSAASGTGGVVNVLA